MTHKNPLAALLTPALLATAVLTTSLASTGCEEKITAASYTRITQGMTLSEVEKILGKGEKQEISGVGISGAGVAGGSATSSLTTYVWRKGTKEISVTFGADNKVMSTSKAGL